MAEEWFTSWFNSPYYNLLYHHRSFAEAEAFILRLLDHLQPTPDDTFMDLACGRGRHSYFLNRQGYQVTGLDLSQERIAEASQFVAPGLEFRVHDMRKPFPGQWDFILNLFTSFGYFDDFEENVMVLRNVRDALRPSGIFVLDYLNVPVVTAGLVPAEVKSIGEIRVEIRRRIEAGMIIKDIRVWDGERRHDFQERVRAFRRADFDALFQKAGLRIMEVWGDYEGRPWREADSQRLIFFCEAAGERRIESN